MSLPNLKRCGASCAVPWHKTPDTLLEASFYISLICIVGAICHSLQQGGVADNIWILITSSLNAYMAYQAMIWRGLCSGLEWTPAKCAQSDPDYQRCYRLLELAALRLGLPTPTLILYDEKIVNACATANDDGDAIVGVTLGMLDTHTDAELLATLGHEMAHHANGDIQLSEVHNALRIELQVCACLMSGILLFEALLTPLCALDNAAIVSLFLLLPVLAYFLNGLFSAYQLAAFYRCREYAADIGAMKAQPHLYVNKEMLLNVCGDERLTPPQTWQDKTSYWLGYFFGGYARTNPLLWQRFQNLER